MSGAMWRVGLPQLCLAPQVMDGRGVGGGPYDPATTLASEDAQRTSPGDVADDVPAHPLESVDMKTVVDFFNALPREMRGYSDRDRNLLAKRLVVRASRVPWTRYPQLSRDEAYTRTWEEEIPPRAALYFTRTVTTIGTAELVVDVARFLETNCRGIDNKDALLMMFSSCIEALPQEQHVSMIGALLSAMMCHKDLCDARKLTGLLNEIGTIKAAIVALPPDRFGKVCRSLREVEREVQKNAGMLFPAAKLGDVCKGLRGIEERVRAGMGASLPPKQFAKAYRGLRRIEGMMWPGTDFIRVLYDFYFGVDS